jgi:quinol monooxygenase YgiN
LSKIQARAKVKIPFGMLDEYKRYVSEYINKIKEKDSGTLQFDWFISSDKKEAEIIEVYASSEAALKHKEHLEELQEIIFRKFGAPYLLTIYGDPSPELIENVKASEMNVKIFSFLQGVLDIKVSGKS